MGTKSSTVAMWQSFIDPSICIGDELGHRGLFAAIAMPCAPLALRPLETLPVFPTPKLLRLPVPD